MWERERCRHENIDRLARLHIGQARFGEQLLGALLQQRQHDEQVRGNERGEQGIPNKGDDAPVGQAGQRGGNAGQNPEREDQRQADREEQKPLQPLELIHPKRSRRVPRNGEDPVRREAHQEVAGTAERLVEEGERDKHAFLSGQTQERYAQQAREHHDGRHDVIGERAEWIGWNVEVEPIDLRLGRHRGRRVIGTALVGRQRERAEKHQREAQRPQHQDDQAAARAKAARQRRRAASNPRNQGRDDVRQHRDLQQLDECLCRPVENGSLVAQEQADGNTTDQPQQDSSRQTHRGILARPVSCSTAPGSQPGRSGVLAVRRDAERPATRRSRSLNCRTPGRPPPL